MILLLLQSTYNYPNNWPICVLECLHLKQKTPLVVFIFLNRIPMEKLYVSMTSSFILGDPVQPVCPTIISSLSVRESSEKKKTLTEPLRNQLCWLCVLVWCTFAVSSLDGGGDRWSPASEAQLLPVAINAVFKTPATDHRCWIVELPEWRCIAYSRTYLASGLFPARWLTL